MDQNKKSRDRSHFQQALLSVFSKENLWALVLALILIAIYITTASDTPVWIYQGF